MKQISLTGLACILAATLAGCGQKGPLYLPDEARDVVTRPAPPANSGAPESPGAGDSPDLPPSPVPEDADKDKNGKPPR